MLLRDNIVKDWQNVINDLPTIEQLRIRRCLELCNANDVQLDGFCDASEQGYAAVDYVCIVDKNKEIIIYLIIAKSKVAPLKRIYFPRLELCGAYLLAKLTRYNINLIEPLRKISLVKCWSDSMVTLAWIQTPAYRLKTYVANRVSQIQEWISTEHWSHLLASHNPADCATRTIFPSALLTHPLWWSGPHWLTLSV